MLLDSTSEPKSKPKKQVKIGEKAVLAKMRKINEEIALLSAQIQVLSELMKGE